MNIPTDTKLYSRVKEYVYTKIPKHSAYRSGIVVKLYKQLGGKYKHKGPNTIDGYPLRRWFAEKWTDVSPKGVPRKHYPLYRPTRRISRKTPTTLQEIPPKNLSKQYSRKQKLRHNTLPPFEKKNKNKNNAPNNRQYRNLI